MSEATQGTPSAFFWLWLYIENLLALQLRSGLPISAKATYFPL